MAAAAEGYGWADVHEGRNFAVHGTPARRKGARVHASDGAEIADSEAVLLRRYAGTRLLRNFRTGMVRIGPRAAGRCFRRRRQELGGSGTHRARATEIADAIPAAVAMEWRSRGADEPHHRRERPRTAESHR